ncbi:MAG: hypothetical protein ACI31R_04145 [Bacilli bacterium]
MYIIKSKNYQKSYKKKILDKHLEAEKERINNIENLFIASENLQAVMQSPLKNVYHIEQKKNNLKEFYTARINNKLRLIMKPEGSYPYNLIEIEEIEFIEVDDKHYKEG